MMHTVGVSAPVSDGAARLLNCTMASFQRNKHLLFRQEIAEAFNHENGVTSASKHEV
jgi:hypothetical protein